MNRLIDTHGGEMITEKNFDVIIHENITNLLEDTYLQIQDQQK